MQLVKTIARHARRLARDEAGTATIEYVLVAGLVLVGTITVIAAIGPKVVARWTTVKNASM